MQCYIYFTKSCPSKLGSVVKCSELHYQPSNLHYSQEVSNSNLASSPLMSNVASLLVTGELGRRGFVAMQLIPPTSDLCTEEMVRELDTREGSVCTRTDDWMLTLVKEEIMVPLSLHTILTEGGSPHGCRRKTLDLLDQLSGSRAQPQTHPE